MSMSDLPLAFPPFREEALSCCRVQRLDSVESVAAPKMRLTDKCSFFDEALGLALPCRRSKVFRLGRRPAQSLVHETALSLSLSCVFLPLRRRTLSNRKSSVEWWCVGKSGSTSPAPAKICAAYSEQSDISWNVREV